MFCFVKTCKVSLCLGKPVLQPSTVSSIVSIVKIMISHRIVSAALLKQIKNFIRRRSVSILALAFAALISFPAANTTASGLTPRETVNDGTGTVAITSRNIMGPANVCGRVKVRKGRAIAAATLVAIGGRGDTYITRTATFGYYCFIGLSAGETYIITVSARGYYFPEPNEVVIPFEDVYGLDFEAL